MKTRSSVRGWIVGFMLASAMLLACAGFAQAGTIAADDFNRTDDYSLGSTSVGGYAWTQSGAIMLADQQVWGADRSASYEASIGDLDVANGSFSSDLTFNLTNGAANEGVNFAAYYVMRKSTTASGLEDGAVEVRVRANGALKITEDVGGTMNVLYDDDPYHAGYHFSYAGAGYLPATINGAAFDMAQKGYLDHDGSSGYADTFQFGVLLNGTSLSVLYNGQTEVTVALSGSGNSGANIFGIGRASGEFEYAGFTNGNVGFDNLDISTVPEPSALALLVAGLTGLIAYAWRKRK